VTGADLAAAGAGGGNNASDRAIIYGSVIERDYRIFRLWGVVSGAIEIASNNSLRYSLAHKISVSKIQFG